MSGADTKLQVCDFPRSYVRFRLDTTRKAPITVSAKLPMTLNNVRMPLDCRTIITDEATGQTQEFVLGVSCKSEQVWVKSGIWHQPNADMLLWASRDQFVVFKRWDKMNRGVMLFPPSRGPQPEKHLEKTADAFDRFSIDLVMRPGRVLATIDEILEVLFSERPVVAQTEYRVAGHRVLLEYPVKTVNFSERERFYQVDTGPVLLPDFSTPGGSLLKNCRLAFVGHNCPEWVEFIVDVPTPLTDAIKVHHYSKVERIDGTINRMIEVV